MKERIEELHLNQEYSFHVTIENSGTHFAGVLVLTPNECHLTIRGDELEDRRADFPFNDIDELSCRSWEGTFIMYGLKPRSGGYRLLQRHPFPVSHFENKYSIAHVIFVRGSFPSQVAVRAIELDSPSISRWVGSTTTQDEIVKKHNEGTLFWDAELPNEFVQELGSIGQLRVAYKLSTHYSIDGFNTGFQFPPMLVQVFNTLKSGVDAISQFHRIEAIFSFLTGHPLDIQSIRLITEMGRLHTLSLYTPRGTYADSDREYPFFPLGRNLRFDQLGLPEFPLDSFARYFNLTKEEQRYFDKYLRYRQMENPEERFLGFFRLLEKLCFQKEFFVNEHKLATLIERSRPFLVRHFGNKKDVGSLLRALRRVNGSKLNTAGCILRFLCMLPPSLLDRWIYGSSNIDGICQIRNDLTHANEFEPDEFEMERKAKFIEVLLVIGLLCKIGVSIEAAACVIPYLDGHNFICRPVERTVQLPESA